MNAIADLVTDKVAVTKEPRKFLSCFLRFRHDRTYILAGNLDLVATLALYLISPFPGHFILLVSDHRTNLAHSLIIRFYTGIRKARIAFVTEHARQILAAKTSPSVGAAGTVVYHSSKTADLAMDEVTHKPWGDRQYDVLFFGRLNEERGLPEFLAMVEKLPEYQFLIAGGGPLAGLVKDAEMRLENLHFAGFVTGSEKKLAVLSNARVLFSNMQGVENFGISILEAVSAGAAVSCPTDYGPEEILGGQSSYLRPKHATFEGKIEHLVETLKAGPTHSDFEKFHSGRIRQTWLGHLFS